MAYKIVIDAGHGGFDLGASYNGRKEKDDALLLAFSVGRILENAGVDVEYTRVSDIYNSPLEKAAMANNSGADLFLSIHRNASGTPNKATGVEVLVYDDTGIKSDIASSINSNLSDIGFRNRGTKVRQDLVVLKQTTMPALLVEAGFIDNDSDNALFDDKINSIADAIANGILENIDMGNLLHTPYYRVQIGEFSSLDEAYSIHDKLLANGFDSFIIT